MFAGGLFAGAHLGLYVVTDRTVLLAMMTNPVFLALNAGYAVSFPLLLIALVAVYWRPAREAGIFGAVAFLHGRGRHHRPGRGHVV